MDNATSNDKQTTSLAALDNSFEVFNQVWCFNHTLQLSAKALLRPLNPGILDTSSNSEAIVSEDSDEAGDADESPPLIIDDESDDENKHGGAGDDTSGMDDPGDDIDELSQLDSVLRRKTLHETVVVREAVSKVCSSLCC